MSKIELHTWYRQYRKLKEQCPDAILLYRLGDFYEVFDDDAKLVAELLDVTLTRKDYAVDKSKKVKSEQKLFCPMAGMPYHAVENYVAKLVSMGYRVAIAEQLSETASSRSDTRPRSVFASGMETIAPQRGVAHREIVRVLTPGTVVDPSMLSANKNNYLAAVIADQQRIGLAYIELSTGEFAATELSGEQARAQLEGELARLQVAEVLVPDDAALCLPGLEPATAHLSQDLAPMTKQEREMLLPHERVARRLDQESTARWVQGHITALQSWHWDLATARDTLMQQLGVQSLAGFGLDERPLATRAAGAALHYIYETQRNHAAQINTLRVYTTGRFMLLDPQTQRNLELLEGSSGKPKGALVGVLDATRTPMGTRLLRRWLSQPLLHLATLQQRQDAVAHCVQNGLLRAALRQALGDVGDMERTVNRIVQGTGITLPRDLVYLRQALRALPDIVSAVGAHTALLLGGDDQQPTIRGSGPDRSSRQPPRRNGKPLPTDDTEHEPRPRNGGVAQQQMLNLLPPAGPAPRVAGDTLFDDDEDTTEEASPTPDIQPSIPDIQPPTLHHQPPPSDPQTLDPCSDVLAFLEHALDDDPPALLGASNYLRGEQSNEKPRRVIRPGFDAHMDQVIRASIEAQNWINNLEAQERERTGIKSLKVDYNKVFGYYIEVSKTNTTMVPGHYERKQTLVGAERYITAELKEYESVVLNAQQRLTELERDAFKRICDELYHHGERLRITAQKLARLDVIAALAEVAVREQYVRPTLNESTSLHITGGRHPVVEKVLKDAFVPNDTALDTSEQQLLVITGPNMAGKSTVLRQVALIVLMAQIGSFVPAEKARIGLVDRIFTRIGAQDDIATGQSTFMVEMTETAALLVQSSRRSLIILDEVGRGTSTYDGMAIARAVVEYIHNEPRLQCRTLFATHYHELTDLEALLPRVRNYHMAALERSGQVVFLYELRRGSADRSYGIHVAELAGIPRSVIHRANELLTQLEAQRPESSSQTAAGSASEQEPEADTQTDVLPPSPPQPSLLDVAPNPVIEYVKRLNINELTPIEAMTKLYELQKLAQDPFDT